MRGNPTGIETEGAQGWVSGAMTVTERCKSHGQRNERNGRDAKKRVPPKYRWRVVCCGGVASGLGLGPYKNDKSDMIKWRLLTGFA